MLRSGSQVVRRDRDKGRSEPFRPWLLLPAYLAVLTNAPPPGTWRDDEDEGDDPMTLMTRHSYTFCLTPT
jgi:hypothetical protein